jgi:hypothetical protein
VSLSSRASGDGRDRVGVACNGDAARTVRPVAKVNGGNGAPVVRGGEEEVGELLDSVVKLGVEPIWVVGGWRRVLHGEQKAAAGGDRRHSSGSRCGALGIELRGRKAPRGREEST